MCKIFLEPGIPCGFLGLHAFAGECIIGIGENPYELTLQRFFLKKNRVADLHFSITTTLCPLPTPDLKLKKRTCLFFTVWTSLIRKNWTWWEKKTLGRQKQFEFENNLLTKVTLMFSRTQNEEFKNENKKLRDKKKSSLSTQKSKQNTKRRK